MRTKEFSIAQGVDGVYRWAYVLSLIKKPTIIFMLWKIFAWIGLGLYLFLVLISIGQRSFLWDGFFELTWFFAIFLLAFMAFVFVCYLIYSATMGFRYCVLFEMDDKGLRHTQAPRQLKKAQLISKISAMSSAKAGKIGAAGGSILASAKVFSYSSWSSLKSIEILPRRNVIKLNAMLNKNQVYASDENFDFVRDFVLSHSPQAKVKQRQ